MSESNGRFDLNAKRKARHAAEAESARERYTFDFGDPPQTFSFKPVMDWPAETKKLLEEADYDKLIDLVVDKPKEFWAAKPELGDLNDLFEDHGKWAGSGEDLGESKPSQPPVSIPM